MSSLNLTAIILIWLSGLAFIFYGFICITTNQMKEEFLRYKLPQFRIMVGWLELLGGLGSLVGLMYPPLLIFSSAGLSTLMLLGCIVRLKIKDPFKLILPAFALMLVNLYILITLILS